MEIIRTFGEYWTLIPGDPKHPCGSPVRIRAYGGAIPEVVSLLEEMNPIPGTWYAAIDLAY